MAIIFTDSWEDQTNDAWDSVADSGNQSIVAAENGVTPIDGTYMKRVEAVTSNPTVYANIGTLVNTTVRAHFNIDQFSQTASGVLNLVMISQTAASVALLRLSNDGAGTSRVRLQYYWDGTPNPDYSGYYNLSSGWNCVEVYHKRNVASGGFWVRLNGVEVFNTGALATSLYNTRVWIGNYGGDAGDTGQIYFDGIAIASGDSEVIGCLGGAGASWPPHMKRNALNFGRW